MFISIELIINVVLAFNFLLTMLLIPPFLMLAYGQLKDWKTGENGLSLWLAILNSGLAAFFLWSIYRSYTSIIIPVPTGYNPEAFLLVHIIRTFILLTILMATVKLQLIAIKARKENEN